MLNSKHYVPILKWKRAEQNALKTLKDKSFLIPLIEVVMPNYKGEKNRIKDNPQGVFNELILDHENKNIPKIPEEILKCWGQTPIFIDFSLLYTTELKIESLNKILATGEQLGLHLIPVINLNDEEKIKHVVSLLFKKYKKGICLRLVSSDLASIENLNEKIDNFLKLYSLTEDEIDLLIDVKEIEVGSDKPAKCITQSQEIKNLEKWRSLIFASGAFHKDLAKCKFDEPTLIPRLDWQNWSNYINSKKLKRNPTFSDYTIRHPIYDASLQFHPPTTSIKYTLKNDWYILKGKQQAYNLYLVNAKLLSGDTEHFYGENFSYGDKYIAEKAKHYDKYILDPSIKGTGRAEDWIMAGISHHLACTVDQIANLS